MRRAGRRRRAPLVAALLLGGTSSGCLTALTQSALAEARGGEDYGVPRRAWVLPGDGGERLVVETDLVGGVCCSWFPLLERRDDVMAPSLLVYEAGEVDDGAPRRAIRDVWPLEAEGHWPAPTARPLDLNDLPPLQTVRGGAGWVALPQALALAVSVPVDLVLAPLYGLGLLVALW